jgi:hypothetical protein
METTKYLGKSVKVYLKTGGSFYLKVVSGGEDWISGYDEESINIRVSFKDIEIIVLDGIKQ